MDRLRPLMLLTCLGLCVCSTPARTAPEDDDSRLERHKRTTGKQTDPPSDIALSTSEREEPVNFRGLSWGMSPEEVAAVESQRPDSKPSPYNPNEWTGSALTETCKLSFRYEEERLVQWELRFDTYYADFQNRETVSIDAMFRNWHRLHQELEAVYGPASSFRDKPLVPKWKASSNEDRRWGIERGKIAPTAVWEFPESLVELSNGTYWVFDKSGSDNLYLKITYSNRAWLEQKLEAATPVAPQPGGI